MKIAGRVLTGLLLVIIAFIYLQSPSVSANQVLRMLSAVSYARSDEEIISDRRWEKEQWTGDNRPFAAGRQSLDRIFTAKANTWDFVLRLQGVAQANPNNALDQFMWAYATYKQNEIPHPTARSTESIAVALATAPDPHTYDYERLRLLLAYIGPSDRGFVERLYSRNPQDVLIKDEYAFILSISHDKADNDRAIDMAEAVVTSGQDSPNCFLSLADVYIEVSPNENKLTCYRKALEDDEKFLALTPEIDHNRERASKAISWLKEQLAGEAM